MNHQHHEHEPGRPGGRRTRTRWWAAGLAGVTGLALTTVGVAATPAADSVGRLLASSDDRPGQPDRAATGSQHDNSKDHKGKDTGPGAGTGMGPGAGTGMGPGPGTGMGPGKGQDTAKGKGTAKGKDTGKKEGDKGTPVPCDADALIAAITLANARGGATLDLAKDCTYLLTADIDGAGLPAITTPITLNGSKHTTIERAAAADEFRILTVDTGGDLTLNKLTITGGQTSEDGGGIFVDAGGALTTNHTTITRNIASIFGGGIANNGTTRMKNSTASHNRAGVIGGGVENSGALEISKSYVTANTATSGGAGVLSVGTVQIDHSTITDNTAQVGSGGGLAISGVGIVKDTDITNNTAVNGGGAVVNVAGTQLILKSVNLVGNTATTGRGGGIAGNSTNSIVVVEDSLIKNNTAPLDGGGISTVNELVLRHTKVIGNQAGGLGGGIFNTAFGAARLFDTKVVENIALTDGGGIYNDGGTVELNTATGTVVIKNRPNNCVDVPGCAG
ncbi:right-handed parallel beta-helix repeat-containing protein [Salinispora mooreana]|uniref:right-handed parallel beta-helix repeat-containing protein n=1 Tax=Salinispora mooreana TaxID=999545 RepID=UPI00039CC5DF|nr:right-handed parallel beta-helix repeat-containing protein [Salinispora mooreana]